MQTGDPAPPFALEGQTGRLHHLSDYGGRWVVVYFYPKDRTPGCTAEACHFQDNLPGLRQLGAEVLGISIDSTASHKRFAARHDLAFPLLADRNGAVAERYGSLWKLGPLRLAKRNTFIIDPHGRLAKIYRRVNPRKHSDEVVADLAALTAQSK